GVNNLALPDELILRTADGEHTLTSYSFFRAVWTHTGDGLFYFRSDDNKNAILGLVNRNGSVLGDIPVRASLYTDLRISADDRLIAVVDSPLYVYSADDLQQAPQVLPVSSLGYFAWSPVGHTALVIHDERTQVWSPESGNLLDLALNVRT